MFGDNYRRLSWLAAGMTMVMAASLLQTPPIAQAAAWAPTVQKTPSVAGRGVVPRQAPVNPVDQAARAKTPIPVWPQAGAATVKLPLTAPGIAAKDAQPARVRAGSLPVWVAPTKAASAKSSRVKAGAISSAVPASVRVQIAGQDVSDRAGIHGVILSVDRQDGGTEPGTVALDVNYSQFAFGSGGDWGDRLRLVGLPACVLTTPEEPDCQIETPVESRNQHSTRVVTADVELPAAPATAKSGRALSGNGSVFALAAGPAGSSGNYAATALSPSATWQVGMQTGDFGWSYPLRVPPGMNGPSPTLGIAYSSGSVDGRTASTNAQPSNIGEGHSMESGYIERKYVSCSDDMADQDKEEARKKGAPNNTKKTFDQCWKTENANVVLGGHSGQLVKGPGKTWRLEHDDASKIELEQGSGADGETEQWILTTTDGTRYHFGLGKRYAGDPKSTNSTWTVPVFGNHPGEPCYKKGDYAGSSCTQAWRWNLDYVVDPHGNTMSYFYTPETNYYGRNKNSAVSRYVRGGWLNRIEYGDRKGREGHNTATAQVLFDEEERCDSAVTNCSTTTLNKNTTHAFPDVPFDQICAPTAAGTAPKSCPNRTSPTFFTSKRLNSVFTQIRSGAGYTDVESWQFKQAYPDPGDGSSKGLWLDSITHTGYVGGTPVATPPVTFQGAQMPNRVDKDGDGAPPLNKWRVVAAESETGSAISVKYSAPDCTPTSKPATPHQNTRRCFPVFFAAEGDSASKVHYFHKYVVEYTTEEDLTGGGLDKVTRYSYLDQPAWHYDDNELTPLKHRTWGEWRGYGRVQVRTGEPGPQTLTETRFMRGMDEDHQPNGGKRQATVRDSKGGEIPDHPRTNGFQREQITFNGVGGAEVSGSISDPWVKETLTSGTHKASILQTGKVRSRTALAAGGERVTETVSSFDDYGMVTAVDDRGDIGRDDDDLCTRTSYARNTGTWILTNTSQVQTFATKCMDTDSQPNALVSGTRNYYDGSGALGEVAKAGDLTRADVLTGSPGKPGPYITTAKTAYDGFGRATEIADAEDHITSIAFTPASSGPVTQITTTDPKGYQTATTINPAMGLATVEKDQNGRQTDLTYDGLGRLTAVWLPGRTRTSNPSSPSPNMKFTYTVRKDGPITVGTSELRNNGTYTTSYALFDGLLRPRQTQTPSADGVGRILTDTIYDTAGRVLDNNGPYYNTDAPGTDLYSVTDAQIPTQTRNGYDGASRLTSTTFRVKNVDRWRVTTSYHGDRVTVDPPQGSTPTTTISDARGRTVALRQYKASSPTGAYDETTYAYTPTGQQATVTDPAKNVWAYQYDLQGRQVRAEDPDRGTTITTYNNLGQVEAVTDARNKTLAYSYDMLGRRTATHEGSTAGPKLSEWVFDTLAKGLATSSTRWIDGKAYINEVTGYDELSRPTGSRVTIPASAENGTLARTYESSAKYNLDGGVEQMGLPAAPGLPSETLKFVYDKLGQPNRMAGATSALVNGTTYSPFGEGLQLALGQSTDKFTWQTSHYEEGTRRLQRAVIDRAGFANQPAADVHYSYDETGNITKISDVAPGQPADNQCFRQDYLRRTTQAWTPTDGNCAADPTVALLGGPAPYWQQFEYDKTGNRTKEIQHRAGGDTTRIYHYPEPENPQPHGVKKITADGPAGQRQDTFNYDEAGNTTTRTLDGAGQTLKWDIEGHLESSTDAKGTTSYLYDADGTRLIRRDADGSTLYLGGTEIHLSKTQVLSSTRYYVHNGRTIAMRTKDGVKFLASDRHGTAELSIDGATLAVIRRRTAPFGAPRDTNPVTWPGERGFVGGTLDAATGLTHLGAREYDPATGRFLSVDPLIDHGDPQQMNGYAYANNNPVTYSDPTGLSPEDAQFWDNKPASAQKHSRASNTKRYDKSRSYKRPKSKDKSGGCWWKWACKKTEKIGDWWTCQRSLSCPKPSSDPNGDGEVTVGDALDNISPPCNGIGCGTLRKSQHALGDAFGELSGGQDFADCNNGKGVVACGLAAAAIVPGGKIPGTAAKVRKGTIVYRALRAGEDPSAGLVARAPGAADVSPISHVAGKIASPWISTSLDRGVAFMKYDKGYGVVAIDLSRVSSEVVDISTGIAGKLRSRQSNWAKKDLEILIRDSVPADAIVAILG